MAHLVAVVFYGKKLSQPPFGKVSTYEFMHLVGLRTFQPQILVEHQVIHNTESQGGDSPGRMLPCERHHFVSLSSCTQSAPSYVKMLLKEYRSPMEG